MTAALQKRLRSSLVFLPAVIFIAAWHLATDGHPDRQFIFSSPERVWLAMVRLATSGELFTHTYTTLYETIVGFLLGMTTGTILGLALWYSPLLASMSRPYVIGLAAIPIIALAPVMIVWFGIGAISKIMMAAFSTVGVAMVQAFQGANSAELRHLRYMAVLGATRWQVFRIVIVPSATVWVINSMKLNISLALMGAFIGEFISAEKGLGYLIVRSSGLYDMASVFVGCIVLTLIALLLNALTAKLENVLLKWKNREHKLDDRFS